VTAIRASEARLTDEQAALFLDQSHATLATISHKRLIIRMRAERIQAYDFDS
jgi:hypothetical protein